MAQKVTFAKTRTLILLVSFTLPASHAGQQKGSHARLVTDTFNVLEPLMDKLNQNTLVIFDLDNTIWRGKTYLPPKVRKEREQFLHSLVTSAPTPDQKKALEKKFYAAKRELVEPEVVKLIKEMQAKGVKIIALTGGNKRRHKLGIIDDYPGYFVTTLHNLDIDLKSSFPQLPFYEFLTLGKKGEAPVFRDGILFGSRRSKGAVLEAFLQQARWRPNLIIVFDNDKRMIDDYAEAMKKIGIPSILYEYTRARTMPPFDLDAFKKQLQQ